MSTMVHIATHKLPQKCLLILLKHSLPKRQNTKPQKTNCPFQLFSCSWAHSPQMLFPKTSIIQEHAFLSRFSCHLFPHPFCAFSLSCLSSLFYTFPFLTWRSLAAQPLPIFFETLLLVNQSVIFCCSLTGSFFPLRRMNSWST